MSERRRIRLVVPCSTCENADTSACPMEGRCYDCIIHMDPDPNCEGVDGCAIAQAEEFKKCKAFSQPLWDK